MSKRSIFEESCQKLLKEISDLRSLLGITMDRLKCDHEPDEILQMIRERLTEINKARTKW